MSATGASAAIGAAVGLSAAAVTTLTTVAFAVTGISAKINRAAASVFGEDLVKIGNIFGAAYGAFSGAFGATEAGAAEAGAGAGIDTAATAGDYVNAMDAASDAAYGASNFGSLADMGMDAGAAATDYANQADAISQMGGDASEFTAATSGAEATPITPPVQDPINAANTTQQPQSLLPTETTAPQAQGAGSAQAAGSRATGSSATGAGASAQIQQQGIDYRNGSDIMSDGYRGGAGGFGGNATDTRNIFQRLFTDQNGRVTDGAMRFGGQAISGLGRGYAAAMTARQRQEQFEAQMAEERRRMNQLTGLRVTR